MQTQIHAQPIGKLLDTAFRLYRANFWQIIRTSAIVLVPFIVLQIAIPLESMWSMAQNLIIQPLMAATITAEAIAIYHSRPWGMADVYRQGRQRFFSVLGTNFLMGLILLIPVLIILALMMAASMLPMVLRWITVGILGIALIALMIFIPTKYAVIIPAIIDEEKRASDSISYSWKLTSAHFWHSAGVVIAASVISILFTSLPILLANQLVSTNLIQPLLTGLGLLLVQPFQYIAIVCLYYDLRIRSEGYDIELAAQSYGSESGLAALADGSGQIG